MPSSIPLLYSTPMVAMAFRPLKQTLKQARASAAMRFLASARTVAAKECTQIRFDINSFSTSYYHGVVRAIRNVDPRKALTRRISSCSYHPTSLDSMRGIVLWDNNKQISLEDFHIPRPSAGEVLIKTKACGVCHSDLHIIKGELPFPLPCCIGHEISGEVVEHGPSPSTNLAKRIPIGSRVIGAFIMPCGDCVYCARGHDDLCEDFFTWNRVKGVLYDGKTRLFLRATGRPVFMYSMGGLAEYSVVPANALAVLPNALPYIESAILGCAVFTAFGAMTHAAELCPGDSVAVIGVGGVGSSCIQMAKAFGASEIIAVDIHDKKLQNAKIFGATETINSVKDNAVESIRAITGGKGVDIAVEALGNPETFRQCVSSVRPGGKAVIVGLGKVGIACQLEMNHIVRRKIKVIGSYGGRARQDLPKLLKLAETGNIDISAAVSKKYKFSDTVKAYQDLSEGNIIGRAVIEIM